MKRARNTASGGFSLLEVVIAAAILSIALGSLTLFSSRSVGALGASSAQHELDARLRRTVARLADELLPSGLAVIMPDAVAGVDALTYRRSDGAVNGAIRWSTRCSLSFAYERGELDDGLDNNGNGLIDEGVVQWTRDVGQAGEQTVVLCHGVSEYGPGEADNELDDDGDGLVDERGLVFARVDRMLRVSLTFEGRDPEGRAIQRTLETLLEPRN